MSDVVDSPSRRASNTPPPVQEQASQGQCSSNKPLPIQEQASQGSSDFFEEEKHCFRKKTVETLSREMWKELEIHLDPPRMFGGDYKDLAEKYGYNMTYINFLAAQPRPTHTLLLNHLPTIESLCRELEQIKRHDVLIIIQGWIKVNCSCTKCKSLR